MNDERVQRLMAERMGGQLSRRQFVRRLAMLGLSVPAISAVLAACGGDDETPPTTAPAAATATRSTTTTASPATTGSPASSPATSGTPAGSPRPGTPTGSPSGSAGAGTVGSGIITSPTFRGKTLTITCYGGPWEEFMRSQIVPDFERETGAKIELAIGLSRDWMTRMRAAGRGDAPYDVLIANETWVATGRIEGMFDSLPEDKIPNLKDIHPSLKLQDNIGVFALVGPLGIAYMTDQVSGADVPKKWTDLGKYGNKLGIYNAVNSANAQHIMMMSKILAGDYKKWETGFDWIKANLRQAKQTDFSGDMEVKLTTGEINVGILDVPAWARLKTQGIKMEFAVAEEGVFMFEQNTNITVGSKQKDLAYSFINYWLGEQVQTKFARSFYWAPANTKVQIPSDLAPLIPITQSNLNRIEKWDYVWLNSGPRDEMINRWNREMSG